MAGSPIKNEKRRIVQAAILLALEKDGMTPEQALQPAMTKQLEKANDGDTAAVVFLRDSLDGKPAQQLVHSGDAENPVRLEKVVREVTRPPGAATPQIDPE